VGNVPSRSLGEFGISQTNDRINASTSSDADSLRAFAWGGETPSVAFFHDIADHATNTPPEVSQLAIVCDSAFWEHMQPVPMQA
jgi:hypothetical protein